MPGLRHGQGGAVIAPDSTPLQQEPRRETLPAFTAHFLRKRSRADPASRHDFFVVGPYWIRASAHIDRAQFVLRTPGIELRLILEFEQKLQRAAQSELFMQATMNRGLGGLGLARVAAHAVRPEQRPKPLGRRPLLDQQFAVVIEYEKGKRTVKNTAAIVALRFAHVADFAVGLIHQNERLGISG